MQEFEMDSIGVLGITRTVIFIILLTWILYNGELHSRKRGNYIASYGITSFVFIILGYFVAAFSGMHSSFSVVEQIVFWILILFLSLYLAFQIQDMRKARKAYENTHDRESSIEAEVT
jgi:membrane-bound ClpP family serine protease